MSLQDETEFHLRELDRLLDEGHEAFINRYERITLHGVTSPPPPSRALSQAQIRNIFLVSMAIGGGIIAALQQAGAFDKPGTTAVEEAEERKEYWRKWAEERKEQREADTSDTSGQ